MPNSVHSSIANVLIANATSLSGAIDLGNNRVIGFEFPAAWTAANLTFQGSSDGVTFTNLFGTFAEINVGAAASQTTMLYTSGGVPSATVPINTGLFADFPRFIKLRSGTSGAPVAQGADRLIRVLLIAEG